MTTRRNLFIIAGGVLAAGATVTTGAAVSLAGRREPDGAVTAVPDVLLADSRRGLVVLGGARPRPLGLEAAAGLDGRVVYAVAPDGTGGASLARFDPADGVPAAQTALDGGWIPRVVSVGGGSCALSRTPGAVLPAARARTALLVQAGGRQRRYDLAGVIEPDAFSQDDTGLFILEWLPAEAPERYRVRQLDLASGALQPLLTRDKVPVPRGAEEEMRGEGRQAALSPGRGVLYTLYTHQPGHQHTRDLIAGRPGGAHAFVHVLNLVQRWAYCLDLPAPFGEGPAEGHAIAVSPDGQHLAVVDVTSGSLAYADPTSLTIERVAHVPTGSGTAGLVLAPDGRAFVGAGTTVTVLDRGTDTTAARWSVPGTIRGLGLSHDGTRLYAGGTGEIVWLDAGSGALQGRAPVADLLALRHVR